MINKPMRNNIKQRILDMQNIRHINQFQPEQYATIEYFKWNFVSQQSIQLQFTMTSLVLQKQESLTTQDLVSGHIAQDRLFRALNLSISKHPFAKNLFMQGEHTSTLISGQNSIKPKMFTKLVAWMEKICFSTLEFSETTFEISVRILKEYLEKSNETSNVLQMLGCVSLHIASKLNEKTIISIDSYADCCMNIFTKKEFELKEIEVYKVFEGSLPTLTFNETLDFLEQEIIQGKQLLLENKTHLKKVIKENLKHLQFLQVQPLTLVLNLYVEVCFNQEIQLESEQFLKLVNLRKVNF